MENPRSQWSFIAGKSAINGRCSIATFGYKRVAYFHHFELCANIDLHDHTTNVTTAVLRRADFVQEVVKRGNKGPEIFQEWTQNQAWTRIRLWKAFNNPNQSLWNFRIAEYMQERCGMAGAVILMMVKWYYNSIFIHPFHLNLTPLPHHPIDTHDLCSTNLLAVARDLHGASTFRKMACMAITERLLGRTEPFGNDAMVGTCQGMPRVSLFPKKMDLPSQNGASICFNHQT